MNESNLLDASTSKVQRYIRELSSAVSEPQEVSVDEQLLASLIREAGEYSFGLASVEVYSFQDPRLVPVGIWRNNISSVVAPGENVPGVCLVGTLWTDQSAPVGGGMRRSGSVSSLVRRASLLDDSSNSKKNKNDFPANKPSRRNGLVWRELDSIIQDPDAIHGERLKELHESGIDKAAGITFESNGNRGMVVYYAEEGVDSKLLCAVANEMYLKRSTELIGSAMAMIESRKACVAFQHRYCRGEEENGDSNRIVCTEEGAVEEPVSDGSTSKSCSTTLRDSVMVYLTKLRGGGSQIPPCKPWDEAFWTLLGAFCGLIVLSSVNRAFLLSPYEYYLLMGPFGALMTLQYGLSSAPASQPRNVVLGQIVAGAISISFTYIPEYVLPVWIRQAVGPAFAIAAMIKLGIPHPPAGANSVIYAAGNHNWTFYGIAVMCSVISILPATLVNNLDRKRQYPIYWGYLPEAIVERVRKRRSKLKKKDSQLAPTDPTDRSATSLMP